MINKTYKSVNYKSQLRHYFLISLVIFKEFKILFICLILTFSLSTVLLFLYYPRTELNHHCLSYIQCLYYTWLMIFFESPLNYVEDYRIAPLFFLLPLIGLITIANGIVQLGSLFLERRKYTKDWQKMIATIMEDHYIVCGLGSVGIRVVQHLKRFNLNVVAIENIESSRFAAEANDLRIPVIHGDARSKNILESVNIIKAKAILAVTNDDLTNLQAALTARELNPNIKIIIRMFDQNLAKQIQKFLNIDGCYSSSARSARLFAQAAISENILDSFEFSGTTINAIQIDIKANSKFIGKSISDFSKDLNSTVLLHEIYGDGLNWHPDPSSILAENDKLLVMSDANETKILNEI